MAEPEPRASEAQARTSRSIPREPAARGGAGIPAEDQIFEAGADAARRATQAGAQSAGAQTARGITGVGADTGRRLAETGARAMDRSADLWRQSMFPLTTFSSEMTRLFSEFWRAALPGVAVPSTSPLTGPGAGMMQGLMGMPCADLHETSDAYHICVELAGMRPQDVEVMVDGDTLSVRGEKLDTHREDQAGFRVNERRFGRFERRFHLPRDADREAVQADFQNGLLEICVARRPELEHGRRRIQVRQRGEGGQPRA